MSLACHPAFDPLLPPAPPPRAIAIDPLESANCARTTAGRGVGGGLRAPVTRPLEPEHRRHLDGLPGDILRVARAAGLEGHLAHLLDARDARAADPGEPALELLEIRLEVVMRLSSLEIELAALLFEATCTGDQMEAALRQIDLRTGRHELSLTIASIAVGAAAGIGAGLWDIHGDDGPGAAVFGIVGGTTSALLGLGALAPRPQRVYFPHPRNLFVPIYRGDDPEGLYPTFLFRMFQAPLTPGGPTPRDQLLAEWAAMIEGAVAPGSRSRAEALLLGDGGLYDRDLLDLRERMYDALESRLNAFDRDLERLYGAFGELLERPLIQR